MNYILFTDDREPSISHYQVKGARHGVRRYQNPDGSLTPLGREHYGVGEPRKKSNKEDVSEAERSERELLATTKTKPSSEDKQRAGMNLLSNIRDEKSGLESAYGYLKSGAAKNKKFRSEIKKYNELHMERLHAEASWFESDEGDRAVDELYSRLHSKQDECSAEFKKISLSSEPEAVRTLIEKEVYNTINNIHHITHNTGALDDEHKFEQWFKDRIQNYTDDNSVPDKIYNCITPLLKYMREEFNPFWVGDLPDRYQTENIKQLRQKESARLSNIVKYILKDLGISPTGDNVNEIQNTSFIHEMLRLDGDPKKIKRHAEYLNKVIGEKQMVHLPRISKRVLSRPMRHVRHY